jgi:hypothetical protein
LTDLSAEGGRMQEVLPKHQMVGTSSRKPSWSLWEVTRLGSRPSE